MGLILMESEILFSSSNCSLVLVISRLASCTLAIPLSALRAPPLPEACCFSFWACIIACLFFSASSRRFSFLQPLWPSFQPLPCGASLLPLSFVEPIFSLVQHRSPCVWLVYLLAF